MKKERRQKECSYINFEMDKKLYAQLKNIAGYKDLVLKEVMTEIISRYVNENRDILRKVAEFLSSEDV